MLLMTALYIQRVRALVVRVLVSSLIQTDRQVGPASLPHEPLLLPSPPPNL